MVRLSPLLSLYLVLLAPVFGLDNNVLALKQLKREMETTKEGILDLVHFAEDIGPFLKLLVKDVHWLSENLLNKTKQAERHEKIIRAWGKRSRIEAVQNTSMTLLCEDPLGLKAHELPVKQISWLKLPSLDSHFSRDLPPDSTHSPGAAFLMSSARPEGARQLHVRVRSTEEEIYQCRLHLQNEEIAHHTFLVQSVEAEDHYRHCNQVPDIGNTRSRSFSRQDFVEVELQSQDSISMLCKSNANLKIYADEDQGETGEAGSSHASSPGPSQMEKMENIRQDVELESLCLFKPSAHFPPSSGHETIGQRSDEGYYACNRLQSKQVIHHRNLFGELPRDLVAPEGHTKCLNDSPTGLYLSIKEPWQN
ncbi:hypothetical protein TCAL_15689 [Tigriopus californicus]|uniref:Ig-like domain-containing protein n=1 Tax=Tigriopus californicus TaxID=6832 RepID=A0A553P7D4_TIGCA|nr:hypothetical protein TCAL_15689 [Tigriopus californicus]